MEGLIGSEFGCGHGCFDTQPYVLQSTRGGLAFASPNPILPDDIAILNGAVETAILTDTASMGHMRNSDCTSLQERPLKPCSGCLQTRESRVCARRQLAAAKSACHPYR